MSKSFYHERYSLTKGQEEIIKTLLPHPKSTGRPALKLLTFFNVILWILSEPRGAIYLRTTAIGTAFTTNSVNGVSPVCLLSC